MVGNAPGPGDCDGQSGSPDEGRGTAGGGGIRNGGIEEGVAPVIEIEGVDPGVVGRMSWETGEVARDMEVLGWVARFRFVTGKATAERFGVSWQQANQRLRRLERHGLVASSRRHVCEAKAVFITSKGSRLLGGGERRSARVEVQREHEEAIVWLTTAIELRDPAARVLTERECRRLERDGVVPRFSVEQYGTPRGDRKRWPDLVLEHRKGRRVALEIEFAPKTTARLRPILRGYAASSYERVVIYVRNAALGQRISSVARQHGAPALRGTRLAGPSIVVEPWPALPTEQRTELAAALRGSERA